MKKHIKRSLEWFHVLLVLSMLTPLIYIADKQMEPGQIYRMYFAGYLLLVPIIGLMKAERGCKNFIQFLGIFLCMCGAVKIGAQKLGGLILNESAAVVYWVCMVICTVLIAAGAYSTRMYRVRKREARENQDTTWIEEGFRLDRPAKGYIVEFVLIYIIGLFRICPQMCNLALYSTLAYLLVVITHEYMNAIEEYLNLNENMYQVRNIPYKRIYGIGKAFFIGYIILLLFTVVPALLTADDRKYIDIKTVKFQKELAPEDIYVQPPMEMMTEPMFAEMEAEPIIPREVILVLDKLLYAIAVIVTVLLFISVIYAIRKELARFAKATDEEEDVVESLEPVKEEEQLLIGKRTWKRTEEDKVRRMYRRFIRKHRKELPAMYETPTEIEMAAGVADTEEGKTIHEKYEQARYGN